ncbi:MAG: helix-hairpin-helix domain-containing protein [Chitinophagaceae bacterium]|nr:MAG: helix-hairpin-helix domain-containing protein [Chitinophagaceae bacterium]
MKVKNLLLLFFLTHILLIAEDDPPPPEGEFEIERQQEDRAIIDLIESIVEETEAEFEFESYLEDLELLQRRPLDLNRARYEDLAAIPFLTDIQIAALLNYIDEFGHLANIYELQVVPEWDLRTIESVLPFVRVRGELDDFQIPLGRMLYEGDYVWFVRYQQVLEEQRGYSPLPEGSTATRYLGSPYRLYTRLRYTFGNRISYGFTAEKDPGEEFFKGTQKQGFDYYSGHLFLRDIGPMEAIAIGDYEVSIGQGLVMWGGFATRKSAFVMSIKKDGRTLRPYTSVNENRFLRGVAGTVNITDNLQATVFGSHKPVDASVITQTDTLDPEVFQVVGFSSFQQSGLHRTETEMRNRNAVQQTIFGANLRYQQRTRYIGLSAVHHQTDTDFQRNTRPYNQFEYSSGSLTNFSLEYNYIWRNLNFFGETAMSQNGGFATLNGLIAGLGNRADFSLLHRYFTKDYQSLFANAFAEQTRPVNENGLYMGLSIRPVRNWRLDAYADIFRHDWLRFQTDAPSFGTDYLVQLTYRPSRNIEIYGRYKTKNKPRNVRDNEENMNYIDDQIRSNVRFQASYKISESFTLRNRFEMSFFDDNVRPQETGFLIYQDIRYASLGFPLRVTARFALFDTESFDSRIYAYENDVLYGYSIPAFQNRGTRYYLLLRYTVIRNVDLWLRFAQTYYTNRETIGSGLEEIDGNVRSEIKAQVRFRW